MIELGMIKTCLCQLADLRDSESDWLTIVCLLNKCRQNSLHIKSSVILQLNERKCPQVNWLILLFHLVHLLPSHTVYQLHGLQTELIPNSSTVCLLYYSCTIEGYVFHFHRKTCIGVWLCH